jgi:hypothetical protein
MKDTEATQIRNGAWAIIDKLAVSFVQRNFPSIDISQIFPSPDELERTVFTDHDNGWAIVDEWH